MFDYLSTKFNVKNLGAVKYCLGIKFSQNSETISMNQRENDLLTHFEMVESNPIGNLIDLGD